MDLILISPPPPTPHFTKHPGKGSTVAEYCWMLLFSLFQDLLGSGYIMRALNSVMLTDAACNLRCS